MYAPLVTNYDPGLLRIKEMKIWKYIIEMKIMYFFKLLQLISILCVVYVQKKNIAAFDNENNAGLMYLIIIIFCTIHLLWEKYVQLSISQ